MHICKERGGISEFLHRSLMMSKDKMEVTEKILSLTLEIIFLLTGEDFVFSKKKNNQTSDDCQACLSEGSTKDQSPCKESPRLGKTPEEETPEPSETTHSTAEEVPVRCEDVAIFFSMEEWEYLEGHKERYKNVVSERQQSTGCDRVNTAEKGKYLNNNIQVDPATDITEAPSTGGCMFTNPPESCMSPLFFRKCMEDDEGMGTQKYQAHSEEEISPLQCKVEDVPVEISSDDDSPGITVSPECSQDRIEDDKMIHQIQRTGDDMLPNWGGDGPHPPKTSSGLPTSWEVQPDSPHLLIPVLPIHHNGVNSSNHEGSMSSSSPPMVIMVEPKVVQDEEPTLKCKTHLPHLYWQNPQVDASSSSPEVYGDVNIPPVLETPAVHECLQCGQSFQDEVHLIIHRRTHDKVFHCGVCQQSFTDKSSLVVHKRTFHIQEPKMKEKMKERPFSCAECGNTFLNKSSLVKHRRIHTGAFACQDCGKCLSDKTGLIRHQRTHTGEKPYACPECGQRFTRKCHLISHRKVHTSDDSFPSHTCPDCGKCFSVKSVLEVHQEFHKRHKADSV
ncbi:oocyte zinc finger protein XlCOF7.1-like isoform X2 [Hyla sarda]|nr:oocyte zinc finger protein XlCOF7.1-like isoform X2 [Hyla sarda]XP_056416267.1 oocyte zinc finger protein XlCOF7.1-like isoform X2 [Hyla sarda]XP_056416268.1 oocyte zinc finger protein XlCOF7.1-like isoform X2 [Hyla sarda]